MDILPTITSPVQLRSLSIEQLETLATEIRQTICMQVSKAGGHLAPNLGVVELTIALHYVFDFAHDRLLFDVGHQCYPHKLLTGRFERFDKLRARGGLSGFPSPGESSYDLFAVGHAGTAISTAVGMARADMLSKQAYDPIDNPDGRRVVTLIGDASIVNGVAMEGLNNAGTLKRQFLTVLNDNGMSISKPQGAVSQYFDRLRMSPIYADFKRGAKGLLSHVPGGSTLGDAYHKMGEATKAMINEDAWFEHFGHISVGPIDGHSLPVLIEFLTEARDVDRPMVLHVKTIKGKGYPFSENDASTFHSPPAFDMVPSEDAVTHDKPMPCRVEIKSTGRSFTKAFGQALHRLMDRDDRIVAATAAMPDGTGLSSVLEDFPDRAWDTGICESHTLDMLAGLAKAGYKPFFAVYSTFLQRAFDQAFQEVSLQGLALRLCLDRAGLVGGDGAVHHGFCDVSLLRTLPNACLMAAIDEPSLIAALEFMVAYDEGLSAVRYPRDVVSDRLSKEPCPPFELGKARSLTPRFDVSGESSDSAYPDVAVLGFGVPALAALAASEALADQLRVGVWDARFAKPVDRTLLSALLEARVPIVTVEDHSLIGGFGAALLEEAQMLGLDASIIHRLGLPDAWIAQASRAEQLTQAGIDQAGITRAILHAFEHGSEHAAAALEPTNIRHPAPTGATHPTRVS